MERCGWEGREGAGSAASEVYKHVPSQLLIRAGLRRLKYLGFSPLDIHDWETAQCYMPCLNDMKLKNVCILLRILPAAYSRWSQLSQNWSNGENVKDPAYKANTAPRTAPHSRCHFNPLLLGSFRCKGTLAGWSHLAAHRLPPFPSATSFMY